MQLLELDSCLLLVRVRLRSVELVMWPDHSLYCTTQYAYVLVECIQHLNVSMYRTLVLNSPERTYAYRS